ncbi:MAG: nucleoside hydrolase [Bacteroidales bacterium]|nr:nucleoside hydrolase [Bacteroidales bacterium]MCF8346454.1 nucleoside hydrolase [Bacteroidales bacterium]
MHKLFRFIGIEWRAPLVFLILLIIHGCSGKSGISGIWEYQVIPPSGEVTGTINIGQKGGAYSGFVTMFTDTFDLTLIEVDDNHLKMENEGAQFSMIFTGDSLNGEVITASQQLPIKSIRTSKKYVARDQIFSSDKETGIAANYMPKNQPVALIFDSDFGPDYDDVGALAILHAMADRGEVEILATIASTTYPNVAPVLNAFNTYFLRPEIPIAIPTANGLDMGDPQHWSDSIVANYPHKIMTNSQAGSATELYRRILASKPDNSVTIVTVGFLTNMANLLKSLPDQYSDLNGQELVNRKVRELVSMAGWFPEGKEFNVIKDAESSKYTFDNWPTPIVFSGFEVGSKIFTGIPLINNEKISSSPVKDAYRIAIPMDPMDKNGRMSWDQTAVIFAVRGPEPYFKLKEGKMVTNTDGSNSWDQNDSGHYYLEFRLPPAEVENEINKLMMHEPTNPKNLIYNNESENLIDPKIKYELSGGAGFYNYAPSAIIDEYGICYMYLCQNKDPFQIVDYVYLFKGIPSEHGYTWQPGTPIVSPSADGWDDCHICDPDVREFTCKYNGQTYDYIMTYLGVDQWDSKHNQIGLAFSKSLDGPWIKFDKNPLVSYERTDRWGVGQSTSVVLDENTIRLFYHKSENKDATMVARDIKLSNLDNIILGEEKLIPNIRPNAYLSYSEKNVYLVSEVRIDMSGEIPTWVGNYARFAYMPIENDIHSIDAKWIDIGYVGPEDTGFPRNHNPGFLTDTKGYMLSDDEITIYLTAAVTGENWLWSYDLYSAKFDLNLKK